MIRKLFSSKQAQIEKLFIQFVSRVALHIPNASDLRTRLEILAEGMADLPEIERAMVIACDREGMPVCYGNSGFSLPTSKWPLKELVEIQAQYLASSVQADEWAELRGSPVESPGLGAVMARTLADAEGRPRPGFIQIELSEASDLDGLGLIAVGRALDHLNRVVQDALRLEASQLLTKLQKLATEQLAKPQLLIRPQQIAECLATIFRAHALTILIQEEGKLYLSATTDSSLGQRARVYDPRVGLTGFVFNNHKLLRLRNANDPTEIPPGLQPQSKRQLETLAKEQGAFRLLAVPMRINSVTVGVIRALRTEEAAPFAVDEGIALQDFANLLGAVVVASWQMHLDRQIRQARTEAFCISRHERKKGDGVPVFVYANPGAEGLFGLKRSQIVGRNARELYADEKEYQKIRDALEPIIRDKKKEYGPIKSRVIRSKDTKEETIRSIDISYRFLASPYVKPKTHYAISVIRDITDSQLREARHERLVALLEKKELAYFLTDIESRTIESSPAESKLTGYLPDELLGKNRIELYADPSERKRFLRQVERGAGKLIHSIQQLKRKDGTAFFAEGVMHVVKDDDQRVIGYEGLYEDITERIRIQGYLDVNTNKVLRERDLLKKLEENASFHLNFIASLSHQLRTPLGAMVQSLLNLQEGVTEDARFKKRLSYIIGQANVCSLLVQNLAFMDKILRGEFFDFRPINLARLAIQTKLDFGHLLPEKEVGIEVDGDSLDKLRSNGELWGHEGLLRQVLVNLVDNAVKYSRRGTQIRIRGFSAGTQGRAFEITNRGFKISPENRERIFSRGFRTPQAKALIPDGSGLGLWLVRKIVGAHGAKIRCTDLVQDGEERTAFRIYFPYEPLNRSIKVGGS